jgi:hypothetical protein
MWTIYVLQMYEYGTLKTWNHCMKGNEGGMREEGDNGGEWMKPGTVYVLMKILQRNPLHNAYANNNVLLKSKWI